MRQVVEVAAGVTVGLVLPREVTAGLLVGWACWALWRHRRGRDRAYAAAVERVERETWEEAEPPVEVGRPREGLPFECPLCGAQSWNPNDLEHGYCGRCEWWTGDPSLGRVAPPRAPEQRRHA